MTDDGRTERGHKSIEGALPSSSHAGANTTDRAAPKPSNRQQIFALGNYLANARCSVTDLYHR